MVDRSSSSTDNFELREELNGLGNNAFEREESAPDNLPGEPLPDPPAFQTPLTSKFRKAVFKAIELEKEKAQVRNVRNRKDFDYTSIQSDFLNGKIEKIASGEAIYTGEGDVTSDEDVKEDILEINGYIMGGKTLWIFGPQNEFRRFAFNIVASKYVSAILFGIVLANLIMMAIQPSFANRNSDSTLYKICDWFDVFGVAVYTVDVVLKVCVMGLVLGKHTFLRTSVFNVLDFSLVLVGWASIFSAYHFNASVLKGFIVLKILTSMSFLKEMRAIVEAITRSINYIFNVVVFLLFVFLIFGIMGLEFFNRSYSRRCFLLKQGGSEQCTIDGTTYDCEPAVVDVWCGREGGLGQACPGELTCVPDTENPNSGFSNFDHFPGALLTMFQLVTLSGWTDLVYPLMYAEEPVLCAIWFLIYVVLAAFIVADLFMAILAALFSAIRDVQEEDRQKALEEKLERMHSTSENPQARTMSDQVKDVLLDVPRRFVEVLKQEAFKDTPYLGKGKEHIEALVKSKFFNIGTLVIIFSHLALQATEYNGMTTTHLYVINFFTIVYFCLYVVEMVIRLIGAKTLYSYLSDMFNQLDLLLLILQGTGMVVYAFIDETDFLHKFGFLRSLRLLYVLKMFHFKRTKRLKDLLEKSLKGVIPSVKILVFIGYCLFVFAIVGRQIYGSRLLDEDDPEFSARDNFDTTGYGMLTLFKIMTGDDWTASLYNAMTLPDGWTAVIYFVCYYICASFILLNIFTAVVLESFEGEASEEPDIIIGHLTEEEEEQTYFAMFQSFLKKAVLFLSTPPKLRDDLDLYSNDNDLKSSPLPQYAQKEDLAENDRDRLLDGADGDMDQMDDLMDVSPMDGPDAPDGKTMVNKQKTKSKPSTGTQSTAAVIMTPAILPATDNKNLQNEDDMLNAEKVIADAHENYEETMDIFCFCLPTTHPLRRFVRFIVRNKWFDRFMSVIVIVSAVVMIFEPPAEADKSLSPPKALSDFLIAAEWIFLVIFVMELVLKVVSNGFFLSRDGSAYFGGDPWNYFDFSLIVIMIFTTALRNVIPSWLRMLRITRTLRPLKVLRTMPGLKTIIADVSSAVPAMINIGMAAIFIMFLFSVAGVAMFAGKFYSCTDSSVSTKAECSGFFENDMGILTSRAWIRPRANFDNVGWAMFALVEVSSGSDFALIMWNAMDIVGIDEQPKRDAAAYYSLYFVLYLLIGVFFLINIVIAVILDSIDRAGSDLSENQQTWVTLKREIILQGAVRKIPKPKFCLRKPFFSLCEWTVRIPSTQEYIHPFNSAVLLGIIINTIFLCTKHTDQPEYWTMTLNVVNWTFIAFYFGEMIIKLAAYSFYYFFDPWNVFDFVVTWGALLASILGIFNWQGGAAMFVAFLGRIFRVLRVCRLIPSFKGLNMMLNTLLVSLPGIINISILLFVLLFIYGLMAQELFGNIKFTTGFHPLSSFRTFGATIATLFRLATLDNWNVLLDNTILEEPYCTNTSLWNDCGSLWAYAYYMTFYVLGAYVFMNLVTGVIVDNFESTFSNIDKRDFMFGAEDLVHFQETWNEFDPNATGFLPLSKLEAFVKRLYLTRKPSNAFGFDPKKNQDVFHIMHYELKHNLEPPLFDDADDNIFERIKVTVVNVYQKLKLRRYAVTHTSFQGRVLTYQETLFTIARYVMPNSALTRPEALLRETALRVSVINNAVLTIERFYLDFVRIKIRLRKENVLPLGKAKTLPVKAQTLIEDNDEHIHLEDTASDASSFVDDIDNELIEDMSPIENQWYDDPPIPEEEITAERVFDHLLRHCTLDRYCISLKQRVDLNSVRQFVKDRSMMKLISNPIYSNIIKWNGFQVKKLDVRKPASQFDSRRRDASLVESMIIPLDVVDQFYTKHTPDEKVAEEALINQLFDDNTSVVSEENERQGIIEDEYKRSEHVDRYGVERVVSYFLTHCPSTVAVPPDGIYIPDFVDLMLLLQDFDYVHSEKLAELENNASRINYVNGHFHHLRPDGVRRFFRSTASKIAKTFKRLGQQNSDHVVEIDFHHDDYNKETVDESMFAKNLLVSCATWNMHGCDLPSAAALGEFVNPTGSDVFALALQECPTLEAEEIIALVAPLVSRRYILLTSASLKDMHVLIYARESVIHQIVDIGEYMRYAKTSSSFQTHGAAGVYFSYKSTHLLFMNIVLPNDRSSLAGSTPVETRNEILQDILEDLQFKETSLDLVSKFHHTFLLGTTNYSINLSNEEIADLKHFQNIQQMVKYDQLIIEKSNHNSALQLFHEGGINFQPSHQHSSSDGTVTGYSDRILWASQPGFSATCRSYKPVSTFSLPAEHLPIVGQYFVNVANLKVERTPSTRAGIHFDFLQLVGMPKVRVIKRPTVQLVSEASPNSGLVSDKTMYAYNPRWPATALSSLKLNTESLDHLQFDRIVVVVYDGGRESEKRRRIGRAIVPLGVICDPDCADFREDYHFEVPFYTYQGVTGVKDERMSVAKLRGCMSFVKY
mmetsp:Transcript_2999/g.11471  ORF Transcript_2999/g.11471 Transcript_2999/m.11471 type:complete len:2472 (-) Transcript_2999:11-7426(-)|eukprot:CAMPEP_0117443742 /NCGR_PEP_ID=MMETSP0759-20121206/4860_1 /TAXON_ID=63605 /ORGANISM="Percolomonas cosmopolitus, Strain WS" /LENGTH=2471 /DNA_ID=CAMNT_0005235743 /DNA_START=309 /DNA_END=7724 /DNA_ORIENTATION=+